MQGGPVKVSHLWIIIKLLKSGNNVVFKIKHECNRSTRILSVGIKYSMRDLICDVIVLCFKLCYLKNYKYMIKSQLKTWERINRWISKIYLQMELSFKCTYNHLHNMTHIADMAHKQYGSNSTWLDSTRHVRLCRASRDERVERDEPCSSNMADDERSCTSLVVFMLLHTQILFVSSNKIN